MMNKNAQIFRWVVRNDKVIIVLLLPVVVDIDKMLKCILANHSLW